MNCPRCQSKKIRKQGKRHNKTGDVQMYNCKDCAYKFSKRKKYPSNSSKMTKEMIIFTMDMHIRGHSLRSIVKKIYTKFGVNITHSNLHYYITKFEISNPRTFYYVIKDSEKNLKGIILIQIDELLKNVDEYNLKLRELLEEYKLNQKKIVRHIINIEKEIKRKQFILQRLEDLPPNPKEYIKHERERIRKKIIQAYYRDVDVIK